MNVGLMLMEQFTAPLATWQRNVSSLSLRLDVCCERPRYLPTGQGLFETPEVYKAG